MVILNFFTEKVQKYHAKKLNEALQKLKFHQELKKRLENEIKIIGDESKINLEKEIGKQNEIIAIWKKNIEKINEQLAKLKK
ncbi:hypothetical protein [Nitrosopumilus ureiphilus]|uniref:Uncharacterized protein n=1 Tax=Nitrosopumilus ureiphilus TaxID=1470067 RepID=A0A7D5M3I0_9ARCH|nr:hypothetical protein [Nitrosopumilus ureiphilus]QLH06226.1 hypothetical protein C5F50_03390 [Nitrosopumilus ureiphilus]